ncbi:MAG: dephospho-CoA kinase, partial [Armatimonadetes bacterium]|nr:dephospho-CoA kinase [Armatimonadota bacterium]
TGVSTVAKIFRELGAIVIEADKIAREVVVPGTDVHRKIVEAFGKEILHPDGTIHRQRLGQIVFTDATARRKLNRITHPSIRRRIQEEVAQIGEQRPDAIVLIDVPLLLDTTGPDTFEMDGVIVVTADGDRQIDRLMNRDGLSREDAERRVAAQRPAAEKAEEADWVVDNSGSVEETRRQVEGLWKKLEHPIDRPEQP